MKSVRSIFYTLCALALVCVSSTPLFAEMRLIESITAEPPQSSVTTDAGSDKSGMQEQEADNYTFSVKLNGPISDVSAHEYPNLRLVSVPYGEALTRDGVITCTSDKTSNAVSGTLSVGSNPNLPNVLSVTASRVTGEGKFGLCPLVGQTAFTDGLVPTSGYFTKNDTPTIAKVSSRLPDAIYRTGETILVEVLLTEPVRLSSGFNATLDLNVGQAPGTATLVGGPISRETVTDTLVFTYMVSYRDSSQDLQYESTSALSVLAGTMLDQYSLVPVSTVLPPLDSLQSLAGSKNISLNTEGVPIPIVLGPSESTPNPATPTNSDTTAKTPLLTDSNTVMQSDNGMVTANESIHANTDVYCPAIKGYWQLGDKGRDVKKIQMFLNVYEGQNLKVDGIYGYETRQAVKEFQRSHKDEILSPWGLTAVEATGYWYKTTSKAANHLVGCDTASIQLENGKTIEEYPSTFTRYIETLPQPFYKFIRDKYRNGVRATETVNTQMQS